MNVFAQILKLFPYITVLTSLINLMTTAERIFGGTGSGAQKMADVLEKWTALVTALKTSRLLNARLADGLIAGAPAIAEFIVQLLKSFGLLGGTGDTDDGGDSVDDSGSVYRKTWPDDPRFSGAARTLYKPRDVVWKNASGQFVVVPAGVNVNMTGATRIGTFDEVNV